MKFLKAVGVVLRRVFLVAVVAFALVGFLHTAWPILLSPESTVSKFIEALFIVLVFACGFLLYSYW